MTFIMGSSGEEASIEGAGGGEDKSNWVRLDVAYACGGLVSEFNYDAVRLIYALVCVTLCNSKSNYTRV